MFESLGSLAELDRIESFLRGSAISSPLAGTAPTTCPTSSSDSDPDNLPLVFVYYTQDTLGADYYQKMIDLVLLHRRLSRSPVTLAP